MTSRKTDINGFQVTEHQLEATGAALLKPSGEHIVTYLAESPAFEGIGNVKARKLWDVFGDHLYSLLDAGDAQSLTTVLTAELAATVVSAWAIHGDSVTLQWLQRQGFDVALGRKVIQCFGADTSAKIEEDPYRLLSFCGTWKQVDTLARTQFSVPLDDPRRLQAAIEEVCYRRFAGGHTAALTSTIMAMLKDVLGQPTKSFSWRDNMSLALESGPTNGSYVVGLHGVQPLGAMAMEAVVARAIAQRIAQPASLMPKGKLDEVLSTCEATEDIQLNDEQRRAVHTCSEHAFSCITGGAGVGKTTVLKALYEVYSAAHVRVVQVALAGRAAKRMQEATNRPASTIATFLKSFDEKDFSMATVLVIDEASMTDIVAMSRICEVLPGHVRIVLVGDPNQLMPVGPGLVLHAVTTVPGVPTTELKVVKRYGNEIAAAAASIRDGVWPALKEDGTAISFIPCALDTGSLAGTVYELYALDPTRTQILSPRRNGPGGVKWLNVLCQQHLTRTSTPLTVYNTHHEQPEHTGLYLGDIVLCTRNMWERGLQNGSLGRLVEIEQPPRPLVDAKGSDAGFALAWIEWDDGIRRPLVEEMLDDIELGYAITVHKAQGSQWPRIIIPVTRNRLLDRTLLYTAVTRAQHQVILVGDETAAREAVRKPPRAQSRQVLLDLTLRAELANQSEKVLKVQVTSANEFLLQSST